MTLNRPMMWEQIGIGNQWFARSHFNYDNLSRLKASWRDEQAGKGEWFGYNATGQLTDVSYNADGVSTGPPQNASRTVAYTIAPNTLNRSSMDDNGDISGYTPNALNQYENVAGGSMYYDGNFNLLWTGGFSAWYDSANRLRSVSSGENYGEFTYDGLGRCLKRTVDWETTLIVYDGWKPIVEWDEWNGLKAWNIYGPGPDEILYRHDAYLAVDLRYHLDRMGNVAFLLDSDGDGIERYTYDAFGHPTVTDWNGENPRPYSWYGNRFMFTGREYFPGLGLYDYRNRFYHPILGRFLQSDPIGFGGGDANLFRYCGGDPVNFSDPMGTDVRMFGYGANFGYWSMSSVSVQSGISFGWRNPLTWTIGYNISYVPATSLTSFSGYGASALYTVSPGANHITDLGQAGDVSYTSGAGAPVPRIPIWQIGADYGWPVGDSPATLTLSETVGTPADRVGFNFVTASVTYASGEISIETLLSIVGEYFNSLFSNNGQVDAGPPDNDPARIIVYAPPLPSGSSFGGGRLGGMHFGAGLYQGVGPQGFGGHPGFGGTGGPFQYGTGVGQGFGGVGNNSAGVTIPPLKKPH